jgi:hypothetical protein
LEKKFFNANIVFVAAVFLIYPIGQGSFSEPKALGGGDLLFSDHLLLLSIPFL